MNSVFAYNLILPKEKKTVTTNQYAFFVGKAQNTEIITINDKRIFTASNGAFAHSVKLKDGKNRVVVRSNYSTQIYNFYKKCTDSVENNEACEMSPECFNDILYANFDIDDDLMAKIENQI